MKTMIKLNSTRQKFPTQYGMYYDADEPNCVLLVGGDNDSYFIVWDRAFGYADTFQNKKWIRFPKNSELIIVQDED